MVGRLLLEINDVPRGPVQSAGGRVRTLLTSSLALLVLGNTLVPITESAAAPLSVAQRRPRRQLPPMMPVASGVHAAAPTPAGQIADPSRNAAQRAYTPPAPAAPSTPAIATTRTPTTKPARTPTAPAARPTSPAGAIAPPAPSSSSAQAVFAALNSSRAAAGLPALAWSSQLAASAYGHNEAMAAADSLSHQLPGEATLGARISAQGVGWNWAAENIGQTSDLSVAGALSLESMMMAEVAPNDGHRQNILSTEAGIVGISIVIDQAHGQLWLTEDFARVG